MWDSLHVCKAAGRSVPWNRNWTALHTSRIPRRFCYISLSRWVIDKGRYRERALYFCRHLYIVHSVLVCWQSRNALDSGTFIPFAFIFHFFFCVLSLTLLLAVSHLFFPLAHAFFWVLVAASPVVLCALIFHLIIFIPVTSASFPCTQVSIFHSYFRTLRKLIDARATYMLILPHCRMQILNSINIWRENKKASTTFL